MPEDTGTCRVTDIDGQIEKIFIGNLSSSEEVGIKLHEMTGLPLTICESWGYSGKYSLIRHYPC